MAKQIWYKILQKCDRADFTIRLLKSNILWYEWTATLRKDICNLQHNYVGFTELATRTLHGITAYWWSFIANYINSYRNDILCELFYIRNSESHAHVNMPTSLYDTCLQHDSKWPSNLIKLVNKEPITLRSVMQLYLIMSLNLYQRLSRDISRYSTPKNHALGSRTYILKLVSLHRQGGNIRFPGAREVAMRGMGYVDHKVPQRNEITTTTEQNTTTSSLYKIHCKTRPDPRQVPSLKRASDTRVHSRYLVNIVLSN